MIRKELNLTYTQRDQAWAIRAYPCTGLGIWLVPFIPLSPAYPTILKRLIAGDTFMDIGCFLGGDMRRLAFDGAPTANMYGIDIVSHWEVGYSLYRDADQFNAHFIEDDFLSSKNPVLQDLMGKVDIISISAVLHQWDLRDQIKAAKRLVTFTKPGALVVGYQIGNVEAKIAGINRQTFNVWRHNPASFTKMWDQVGEETGTKWKTESCLRSWEDMGWDPADMSWMEPGARALDFVVTRTQ
jgi:hypothetical protein